MVFNNILMWGCCFYFIVFGFVCILFIYMFVFNPFIYLYLLLVWRKGGGKES